MFRVNHSLLPSTALSTNERKWSPARELTFLVVVSCLVALSWVVHLYHGRYYHQTYLLVRDDTGTSDNNITCEISTLIAE